MAAWMSLITGRQDTKTMTLEAIIGLRQQLDILEKKEVFLQGNIDEELRKAKANVMSNKAAAATALRRKKEIQNRLDALVGQRTQLEIQLDTIESANLNAETLRAMKKASEALKAIHRPLSIGEVDTTMEAINSQRELANEISEAIVNASGFTNDIDEHELEQELLDLESEELNDRLRGAEHAPIRNPGESSRVAEAVREEDEETEEELRRLQAEMAAM